MFVIGVISDAMLNILPRIYIILTLNITLTLVCYLSTFLLDHIEIVILLVLISAVTLAELDCLIPAELHASYGEETFGQHFGLSMLCGSILCVILQLVLRIL